MLDNVEKLMWKYLLDIGLVVMDRSHYGTSHDFAKSEKCRKIITEVGIDWEKTKGVKDDYEDQFNGTFDEPAKVTFLLGTLVTNDGQEWVWHVEYDEPFNVLQLVKDFIPDPFEVL